MEQSLKTLGIIAEYNPFHNGHRYQIQEIKRRTGAENIIIIMGGPFLQRGLPAITDKYLRTEMALSCGADFVLELPAVFATASAESFAYGGVSLLHQLGCVDGICFGSECGELTPLYTIADYLSCESQEYRKQLHSLTTSGISFPAARNQILSHQFPEIFQSQPDLLASPNNILAIEYLKALRQLDSPLIPITIPRSDLGYHADVARENFLSASALRKLMLDSPVDSHANTISGTYENFSFARYIPKEVDAILAENRTRFPVTPDDFSEYLFYALNTLEESHALTLSDMSVDLWNRIIRKRGEFQDFSSFTTQLKTKQYTHSRISRILCHILLQIHSNFLKEPSTGQKIPALYGRILGFRQDKSALLRNIKHFPLINKLADAEQILERFALEKLSSSTEQQTYLSLAKAHLRTDINASALYRRALYHKSGRLLPEEHRAGIIRY